MRRLAVLVGVVSVALGASVPRAGAAVAPAPGWTIESLATPSNFSAHNETNSYRVFATNAGDASTIGGTGGSPIVLTDTLPEGVTVRPGGLQLYWSVTAKEGESLAEKTAEEDCTMPTPDVVKCVFPEALAPDAWLELNIGVEVSEAEASGVSSLSNEAAVSGGGAAEVKLSAANPLTSTPPPFGPSSFDFFISGHDGKPETQAGGHPYELTTTIGLENEFRLNGPQGPNISETTGAQDLKDVVVDLPVGFLGSTLAAPTCTLVQLAGTAQGGEGCAASTVVGHIRTEPAGSASVDSPIYNLTPERGAPAEFGYVDALFSTHVFYVRVVPTPEGYVLQATNPDIPAVNINHIVVTFYGEPEAKDAAGGADIPFFTNPTDCSAKPLKATIYMDSWQNPGSYDADGAPDLEGDPRWVKATSESPPVSGCEGLQFAPQLTAQPTTARADSPSGMELAIGLPQSEQALTSATPALRDATVSFPPGFTIDPSAGNGLQACSEAQIGWEASAPGPLKFDAAPPQCPEASKVGALELTTPLLPGVLHGEMYLANQNENPYNSTLGLYVVVQDPVTGILIKLAGKALANPQTGQITGVFEENPQLPFSELKLSFFGGPRAELATPESCGAFTATSELEPWSAPFSGPNADPFGSFTIDEGCVSGFHPAFTAGSTNLQAGAYTTFQASFSREDTDQELGGLSVSLPPGLLADVGSVPLCAEAQANAGTCPESTQVGTVDADAGPGPNPLSIPGKVYLTGPYNGGPYGLSVVVPAIAGPFDFGLVVVRQSLRIDPHDAHVTDVSDPLPTILNPTGADGQSIGIPIRLRRIDVNINGAGGDLNHFTFNPTNCSKLQVSGSLTSSEGQSAAPAVPFQVTNCASLEFQPKFTVSTTGHTSKALGASLTAKLTYGSGGISPPQGTEANIARVKVDLPKQLPSQLKTLQKACTSAQFERNPANCPKESKIGYATVHTPILSQPLSGPAIFVSHGNEAFPSLTMVLQGDGVTIDLVGATLIKNGITSTTFKTVPDTPFSSFELRLSQGKYAALNTNLPAKDHGNLCGQKLAMPTAFVAQNGVEIHETTPIGVTGCGKAKALTRAQKLTRALQACKKKSKGKRAACVRQARNRFGPTKRKKR